MLASQLSSVQRAALGAALCAFGAVFYSLLVWRQPVPEGLPSSGLPAPLAGVFPFYGAPAPWPAVEWNVWQGWRDSLPLQLLFHACFLLVSRSLRRRGSGGANGQSRAAWPLALLGCACCAVLRGVLGAALTVLATAGFYLIGSRMPRRLAVPCAWIGVLLLMQSVFKLLVVDSGEEPCLLERWMPVVRQLPPFLGVRGVAQWSTFRNDALRLVSFAVDVADGEADPDFGSLLAYQLYPPLAPAGPIIRYVDFAAQLRAPRQWPARSVAVYLLRTLAVILAAEASLYVLYFPAWLGPATPRDELLAMPPWLLFGALHWVLQFEWLSLTAVWRLSRCVALVDGVEAPEDMVGPVLFPQSFKDVWRLWHASLNLWSVRYIYRPLGGRRRPWLAVPATFLFVAFWHDIRGFGDRPYWYVWALLNSFFLLLESRALGRLHPRELPLGWLVVAGVNTILALVVANVPALLYRNGFTVVGAVLLREGSSTLLLVLAMVFGAGAVFEAARPPQLEEKKVVG